MVIEQKHTVKHISAQSVGRAEQGTGHSEKKKVNHLDEGRCTTPFF